MRATVDAAASLFQHSCLEGALPTEGAEKLTTCSVFEVSETYDACGACDASKGRKAVPKSTNDELTSVLIKEGHCSNLASGWDCGFVCSCEVEQLTGEALHECRTSQQLTTSTHGFCYVDPATAADQQERDGQDAVLSECAPNQKHYIRLRGEGIAKPGTFIVVRCDQAPKP
jgi:hypothetical protein